MKKIVFISLCVLVIPLGGFLFYLNNDELKTFEHDKKFYEDNWGYTYLEIDKIREKFDLTGDGVKVSVIDTGVNSEFIEVKEGINVIENNNNYLDDHGHGTHISSLFASKEIGISPNIDLYVVKALDYKLEGSIENIIKAIEWSLEQNVDIILMSFGTMKDDSELRSTIENATNKGVFVVSSVGNLGLKENIDILYPAKYENVIAVGALDRNADIWQGTTLGEELDFLLPGQQINGHSKDGGYLISSGTSMASAYMSGILALILEKDPDFNKNTLLDSEIYDNIDGYNILDPVRILEKIE